MSTVHCLQAFCLALFGASTLDSAGIVDIWVEDAVSVDPNSSEGVRVAFTLTYPGMNRLDGPTHSALVNLLAAGSDEA